MKQACIPFIVFNLFTAPLASAAIVLTEVDFASNTIELTNIGDTNVSASINLSWCVPLTYGALEGAVTFTPGQTKTYVIGFNLLAAVGNDLWIYKDNGLNFNNESQVITGVVWGSNQAGRGRVNFVVAESPGPAWANTTDFVPTGSVGAGETMQLAPGSPPSNVSSSWIIAAANLGSYAATLPDLTLSIKSGPGSDQVTLFWPTSTAESATLESNGILATNGWTTVTNTPTTNGSNREVVLPAVDTGFFRLAN